MFNYLILRRKYRFFKKTTGFQIISYLHQDIRRDDGQGRSPGQLSLHSLPALFWISLYFSIIPPGTLLLGNFIILHARMYQSWQCYSKLLIRRLNLELQNLYLKRRPQVNHLLISQAATLLNTFSLTQNPLTASFFSVLFSPIWLYASWGQSCLAFSYLYI